MAGSSKSYVIDISQSTIQGLKILAVISFILLLTAIVKAMSGSEKNGGCNKCRRAFGIKKNNLVPYKTPDIVIQDVSYTEEENEDTKQPKSQYKKVDTNTRKRKYTKRKKR